MMTLSIVEKLIIPISFRFVMPLSLTPQGIIPLYLDKSFDTFKAKPW